MIIEYAGGQNKAVWEDVTGSTPLSFVKDCVSFTTTVSARFWLMDCRNVSDAARMATDLYTQVVLTFNNKFVVKNANICCRRRTHLSWQSSLFSPKESTFLNPEFAYFA